MSAFVAKKISDEAYFKIGDIFDGFGEPIDRHKELVVSNSFLKKVYETNLHHYLLDGYEEISDDLKEIFRLGSGFHCYVLEPSQFDNRYKVSDKLDASEERDRIGVTEFQFIKESAESIRKKYPYVMNEENAELYIGGEIEGVRVKIKIDRLHIEAVDGRFTKVEIIDLKGVYFNPFKQKKTPSRDRWELRKKLSSTGYDLQAYFYKTVVEAWLASIGQSPEVSFSLLVASKETHKAQKFRVGEEMLETGREKFSIAWEEVKNFVLYGKEALEEEEVL